jgi:hypothetical protein
MPPPPPPHALLQEFGANVADLAASQVLGYSTGISPVVLLAHTGHAQAPAPGAPPVWQYMTDGSFTEWSSAGGVPGISSVGLPLFWAALLLGRGMWVADPEAQAPHLGGPGWAGQACRWLRRPQPHVGLIWRCGAAAGGWGWLPGGESCRAARERARGPAARRPDGWWVGAGGITVRVVVVVADDSNSSTAALAAGNQSVRAVRSTLAACQQHLSGGRCMPTSGAGLCPQQERGAAATLKRRGAAGLGSTPKAMQYVSCSAAQQRLR